MTADLFSRMFMRPRAKARNTDPRTSLEAADSVKRIRESQQRILDILMRYQHMTDEEIFDYLPVGSMSPSGARSRRHELVERGLVVDSGIKSKTKSGRNTIRWKAVR